MNKHLTTATWIICTVILLLTVMIYRSSNKHRVEPARIGWAVAQSGSEFIGDGLYKVKWYRYPNHGVAITSHQGIKIGDKVRIEIYTPDHNSSPIFIYHVDEWKHSDTTSWKKLF